MSHHAHTRVAQNLPADAPAPPSAGSFPVPPSIPAPGPSANPAGFAGMITSMGDPQAAAAAAGAVMGAAATKFPDEAPGIYDNLVRLPGGLRLGADEYIWTAEIRELNGGDEEKMARAGQSGNAFHYLETLLACGVVRLGDKDPGQTAGLLPRLLIGDRDMLGLAIRIATYGEIFDVYDYVCPMCGGLTAKISCSILPEPAGDIELRTLAHPDETAFDIPLRHGGIASVRLPSGEDQRYLADFMTVTGTERNSALLRRCVTRITEPNGIIRDVAAEPSVILAMPAGDRKTIIREISERQPGPQLLQGVKFRHIDCGKEVSLPVTLGALFL